ncbi:MAG: ComEC/Rec2 family competence protein, partial [Verrucomicrobiae bacterium]|nr:ComEC/Rec2 family competence protein [Verrucomicrobiae bacterium]
NLSRHDEAHSPHDLRRFGFDEPVLATLRGRLATEPALRRNERRAGTTTWRTRVILEVRHLRRRHDWEPAAGRVAVSLPEILPAGFHQGSEVEVYGILRRPAGPVAEGLFDWARFLRNKGIWYELVTRDLRDWRPVDPGGLRPSLPRRYATWARRCLSRGLPEEEEEVQLIWAMALGWRTALTDEVAEPFMRTGTMHLFAISGLHIGLISGMLVAVLRVLQVPRGACVFLVVPALWFYVAATRGQPSAVRASIMMTVVVGGWSLRRPGDLLNSLCAAGFLILLWDPLQLFQASFQLSFFVVLGLALLMPFFEGLRERLLQVDPLLPPELLTRWQRMQHDGARLVLGSLGVSIAAWLGSFPLIMHYFNLVTPVSLLANVVMVPLGGLAVMSCLGSLATGAWFPGASELFNHAAWFWMHLMTGLSQRAATWPGAFHYVMAPAAWQVGLYYAVLVGCVGGRLWQSGRRQWLVPCGLGLLFAWGAPAWARRGRTEVVVLPMNGGGAIWVDAPGRRNDLLIDCGDEYQVERLTLPVLRSRGVNVLPRLVLTHGDVRHVGGVGLLAEALPIREVVVGPHDFRSPSYREFVARLREPETAGDTALREVVGGDAVAGWEVRSPPAGTRFARADDNALVLTRDFVGTRVLLLSDLGSKGQGALLAAEGDLGAEVVVAGLPVDEEPLMPRLLDRVVPRRVVLTDAAWPAAQHAGAALRGRLVAAGATVLATSEAGTVTLILEDGDCEVRLMPGR